MITRNAPRPHIAQAQAQLYIPEPPLSVTRKELAKHRSTRRRTAQIEARIAALTPRVSEPGAELQLNALSARLQALKGC